jgi:hypothetical protein
MDFCSGSNNFVRALLEAIYIFSYAKRKNIFFIINHDLNGQ